MLNRRLLLAFIFIAFALSASAQALWTSVSGEHKFNKQLSLDIEGEHRFADGFDGTARWAFGLGADYKFNKHIKAGIGYKYIHNDIPAINDEEITMKLNGFDYATKVVTFTDSYWDNRHRVYASVTGDIDLGNFNISLREMYQYTHHNEASANRTIRTYEEFDDVYDGVPTWYDDYEETVGTKTFKAKDKHILRSRLEVDYNKKGFPLSPYANVELFNDLSLEKVRFTVGTDWKINKQHSIGISYFYQDIVGEDEDDDFTNHVISLDYKIKF